MDTLLYLMNSVEYLVASAGADTGFPVGGGANPPGGGANI